MSSKQLYILHFNDVYNLPDSEHEPVGSVARFASLLNQLRRASGPVPTITLFSGDCMFPSLLSTETLGHHMAPVMAGLEVDCAVCGNHEFDAGVEAFEDVVEHGGFPWVLSNVFDAHTGATFAGCKEFVVLEKDRVLGDGTTDTIRVGLIGLAEKGWFELLGYVSIEDVSVKDFVEVARTLGATLRDEHKCDVVIALTHMLTEPNDLRLARECPEIDMVLGGHDHNSEDRARGRPLWVQRQRPFDDEYRKEMAERAGNAAAADSESTSEGVYPGVPPWVRACCFGGATTRHIAGRGNEPEVVLAAAVCGDESDAAGAGATGDDDGGVAVKADELGGRFIYSDWDFKGLTKVDVLVEEVPAGSARVRGASAGDGEGRDAGTAGAAASGGDTKCTRHTAITIRTEHYEVHSGVPMDESLSALTSHFMDDLHKRLSAVVGETAVPLETRAFYLRPMETPTGNWVADRMREAVHADCAVMIAGALRGTAPLEPGPLRLEDVINLHPDNDGVVKIRVSGKVLLAALENGVRYWPGPAGRFPCVSGIRFAFDGSKPELERVESESVEVNGKPLELDGSYTVATKPYVAEGNDGYVCFEGADVLIDEEHALPVQQILRNHLRALAALNGLAHSRQLHRSTLRRIRRQKEEAMRLATEARACQVAARARASASASASARSGVTTEGGSAGAAGDVREYGSPSASGAGIGAGAGGAGADEVPPMSALVREATLQIELEMQQHTEVAARRRKEVAEAGNAYDAPFGVGKGYGAGAVHGGAGNRASGMAGAAAGERDDHHHHAEHGVVHRIAAQEDPSPESLSPAPAAAGSGDSSTDAALKESAVDPAIHGKLLGILGRIRAGKRLGHEKAHEAHAASGSKHEETEAKAVRGSRGGSSAMGSASGGLHAGAPLFQVHPVVEGRIVIAGGMDQWEEQKVKCT